MDNTCPGHCKNDTDLVEHARFRVRVCEAGELDRGEGLEVEQGLLALVLAPE